MYMLKFKLICLKTGRITTPDLHDTSLYLSVQHTTWFHLLHLHYQSHYIVVVQTTEPIHITFHQKYSHLCNQSIGDISTLFIIQLHVERNTIYLVSLPGFSKCDTQPLQCQSPIRNTDIINQTFNSTDSKML
mgnify:CR=1 FL=1